MKHHYKTSVPARYSRHADIRMQQRSIPTAAVELLLDYAEPIPVGGGARSYRFTNHSWAEAEGSLGAAAKHFAKYRNAYVIEGSDGVVITVAWLH